MAWHPSDRESDLQESRKLFDAVRDYISIAQRFDSVIEEVLPLSEALDEDDPNGSIVRGAILRREKIDEDLFVSGTDDPRYLVDDLWDIFDILMEAANEIGRDAGWYRDPDRGRPPSPGMTDEVSQAFSVLELDTDPPPDYETAKKAWKKKITTYHPDRDPKHAETAKEINRSWDILDHDWYIGSRRDA